MDWMGTYFSVKLGREKLGSLAFGPEIRAGVPVANKREFMRIHGKRARTLKDKFLRSLRSRI